MHIFVKIYAGGSFFKKISEMVKRGETIFKSKIKWILALILLTGCIYGSYTLSRYTEAAQVEAKQAQVILDAGHGGCR
mgnify:CR=1 FL=1